MRLAGRDQGDTDRDLASRPMLDGRSRPFGGRMVRGARLPDTVRGPKGNQVLCRRVRVRAVLSRPGARDAPRGPGRTLDLRAVRLRSRRLAMELDEHVASAR